MRHADLPCETPGFRARKREIDVGDAERAEVLTPSGRLCLRELAEPALLENDPSRDARPKLVGRLERLQVAELAL